MATTIKIGHSDVISSTLGLGTNKVGANNLFPGLKDSDGAAVVKHALDLGITMLDTAYMYGLGRSEEIIGDVTQDYDRHKIILATKAAQDPEQDMKANNRPEFLTHQVDLALERLKTDYLDIFYIHFPDKDTPKAVAVGALQRLKEAGKIRAIGVSNFSLAQLKEANQDGYVDIVEDRYNLIHRDVEQERLPYLKTHGITFVPYVPLASGLLTGKFSPDHVFAPDDWRASRPDFQGPRFIAVAKAMQQVTSMAKQHQATASQLILAWYLANPAVGVVIPGARVPAQVDQNAKARDIMLSSDEYKRIDQLFAHLPA